MILRLGIAFGHDAATTVNPAHFTVEDAGAQGHGELAVAFPIHEAAGAGEKAATYIKRNIKNFDIE